MFYQMIAFYTEVVSVNSTTSSEPFCPLEKIDTNLFQVTVTDLKHSIL